MKRLFLLIIIFLLSLFACTSTNYGAEEVTVSKVGIIINDIPFETESYLRIPYTLKIWEFEKEGLMLNKIQMIDAESKTKNYEISKEDFSTINLDPLPSSPLITWNKITNYYMSLQILLPLGQKKLSKVQHIFSFRDSVNHQNVIYNGAEISLRFSESPIAISSSAKGKTGYFFYQAINDFHFYVLLFTDGINLLLSNSVPFVLKSYTKVGAYEKGKLTPVKVAN